MVKFETGGQLLCPSHSRLACSCILFRNITGASTDTNPPYLNKLFSADIASGVEPERWPTKLRAPSLSVLP